MIRQAVCFCEVQVGALKRIVSGEVFHILVEARSVNRRWGVAEKALDTRPPGSGDFDLGKVGVTPGDSTNSYPPELGALVDC